MLQLSSSSGYVVVVVVVAVVVAVAVAVVVVVVVVAVGIRCGLSFMFEEGLKWAGLSTKLQISTFFRVSRKNCKFSGIL